MANTFEAISRDPQALKDTISKSPPTLRRGHRVAARAAPVPRAHGRALARPRRRRRPSCAARCRRSTRRCASARRCSGARSRSTTTCRARSARSRTSSRRRRTIGALRGLTATVGTLQPQLRYLGPYVTVCNSWNFFWTFAAEHLSAPDDTGSLAARAAEHGHAAARAPTASARSGANEFAHGKGALPGTRRPVRPQQRLRRRPSTTTATPTAAPARPATSRPTTRCATRASRATRTRAPSTERFPIDRAASARPTRSSTSDGKGVGLNPDHVPGGRDVHRPPGRPRRRHREGARHEAQAAQGPAAVRRRAAHARGARRRDLLRLHQGDPVQAPLHGAGRLPVGQRHPHGLAGADRRRQRRQGHRRSATSRTASRPRS